MASRTKYNQKTVKGVQERLGQPGTQSGSANGTLNKAMDQGGPNGSKTSATAPLGRTKSVAERLGQA